MQLREHALVYLQQPLPGRDDVFEFGLVKAISLPPCFHFPATGNSRILFDADQYLKDRPFLFIIAPRISEVHSLRGCVATIDTVYGQKLPANSALPVPLVQLTDCPDEGIMPTDTYVVFYDSETRQLASAIQCIGEPLLVPIRRVCTKHEFLLKMAHTRKMNIDITTRSSRCILPPIISIVIA